MKQYDPDTYDEYKSRRKDYEMARGALIRRLPSMTPDEIMAAIKDLARENGRDFVAVHYNVSKIYLGLMPSIPDEEEIQP